MKTQKLNFDAFTANELTKNQKKTILGKGDAAMQSTLFTNTPFILSTFTTPTVPPGAGGGSNGDAKIIG